MSWIVGWGRRVWNLVDGGRAVERAYVLDDTINHQ